MKRDERKEQTQFNNMVNRHQVALIEVKTVPNKKYQQEQGTKTDQQQCKGNSNT